MVFETISKRPLEAKEEVFSLIEQNLASFVGNKHIGSAGFMPIDWDKNIQRGIVRVNNKYINDLKASFILNNGFIFKSVGVSGILKKARNRYMGSGYLSGG